MLDLEVVGPASEDPILSDLEHFDSGRKRHHPTGPTVGPQDDPAVRVRVCRGTKGADPGVAERARLSVRGELLHAA